MISLRRVWFASTGDDARGDTIYSTMPASPLTPLASMLDRLLASAGEVMPATVPLTDAVGLVAAETVRALHPIPARPQALRRGIAIASSAVVGATPYAPALLSEAPRAVAPGDILPDGCDAVLPADAVQSAGLLHEVGQAAYPGEDVVAAGGDLGADAVIVEAGTAVTAAISLALSLAGRPSLAIRQPVIALRASDHGFDALEAWVAANLTSAGCRIVVDEPASLVVALSLSDRPGGLALNPGRDISLDVSGPVPILEVPARFDQVAAAVFGLLMPLVASLTGRRLRVEKRPLTRKLVSQVGLSDVVLLRTVEASYEPLSVGRITLAALLAADAVAIIDPSSEGAAAGDLLSVVPLIEPFEPL